MTAAEHYAEAERLLIVADRIADLPHTAAESLAIIIATAQVHATLATSTAD